MLNFRELMHLASTFRDRKVLTVYLHTTVRNPADRHMWEAKLEQTLDVLRAEYADESHAERADLDQAITNLHTWIKSRGDSLHAPGVVAIISPDEVLYAAVTETDVPNLATWGNGIHVSPLLREVSLGPSSAVLLLDAATAHVYRFEPPRALELVETLTARVPADMERHMGSASGTFHSGTRGSTTAEERDRRQLAARERLFHDALARAYDVAGRYGWIVIGGTVRTVAAARALVTAPHDTQAISVERLDIHASEAEITSAVAAAVAHREVQRDRETVREIIDDHGSRGMGVAGLLATRAMLDRKGVSDLLLSERFVERRPEVSDELLRVAFQQGAAVREVRGDAAVEIDAVAEGVVARLRYAQTAAVPGGVAQ